MVEAVKDINREEYPVYNNRIDDRLRKVFIIEDNEMHSMMMDYLLSKESSFNIFRFKSGEECIEKMYLKPDVIILDYGLPGINGLQTYAKIKKIQPDIPVVVISSNETDKVAKQFKEMGAYEYIVKEPDSFHRLNSVVESLLFKVYEKQYAANSRAAVMIVGGFILLVLVACLVSYLTLKH